MKRFTPFPRFTIRGCDFHYYILPDYRLHYRHHTRLHELMIGRVVFFLSY